MLLPLLQNIFMGLEPSEGVAAGAANVAAVGVARRYRATSKRPALPQGGVVRTNVQANDIRRTG